MRFHHIYCLLYLYCSHAGAETENAAYSILESSGEETTVAATRAPINHINANVRALLSNNGGVRNALASESSGERAERISSSHVREQGYLYE